ncbi:hypothetical protein [Nocardioides yefusunii]|uniref:Uncharacterized protein n=1 Tax=Nocardioides yefusunii TaxID=2500546 RepID=A0ABW1R242_9ACTN|nr:hypothetical protein [Nocardioides yefusunii]
MRDALEWFEEQRPPSEQAKDDLSLARARRTLDQYLSLQAAQQPPAQPVLVVSEPITEMRPRRAHRVVALAAAAAVIVGLLGAAAPRFATPHADAAVVQVLNAAAQNVSEPVGTGAHRRVRSVAVTWSGAYDQDRELIRDGRGAPLLWQEERVVETWIPTSGAGDWVVRVTTTPRSFQSEAARSVADAPKEETRRAPGGQFADGWSVSAPDHYDDHPRDPRALIDHLREHPRGANPADSQAFTDAADILIAPGAPDDLKVSLLRALCLLEGSSLEPSITLPSGVNGVGIAFPGSDTLVFDPSTHRLLGLVSPDEYPGQASPVRVVEYVDEFTDQVPQ